METLLKALADGLSVRLEARDADAIQQAYALTFDWRTANSVPGINELRPVAKLFADEVVARAEIVDARLRQARLSWSPRQIVENQIAIRQAARDILTSSTSSIGNGIELAGEVTALRQARAIVGPDFDNMIFKAARGALQIVDACMTEIIAANHKLTNGINADLEGDLKKFEYLRIGSQAERVAFYLLVAVRARNGCHHRLDIDEIAAEALIVHVLTAAVITYDHMINSAVHSVFLNGQH